MAGRSGAALEAEAVQPGASAAADDLAGDSRASGNCRLAAAAWRLPGRAGLGWP